MWWYSIKFSIIFIFFTIEKGSMQLVSDTSQTPALGNKGTKCYDQFNRPQRCIPEFENAAFDKPIEATNTCGELGEQEYCVQTGITSVRKSCEICYPGGHHARYLTDFHNVDNPTWWQSETLLEQVSQVNLTLSFGKSYDITYIRLWFYSPRPESFYILKKTTADGPWIPFQYYSATCRDTYGLPDQIYSSKGEETRAFCTSEYSDISPLRGGNVAFGTLEGRPSAYNFDATPALQEWVTATDIMITLDRINTFGDEVFGDQQVLRSYFYAIADIAVGARCKCNGHASKCVDSTGPRGTYTKVCQCEHNTAGPDCSECLPFYNDAPWSRATANDAHECKQCNCNGYSSRCVFDAKLYERTGHGGYCLDCAANRDGANCEKCRPNYFMREDGYCTPCECDQTGSLYQQCNAEGKCQCKSGVTGDKCNRCADNYYDFSKVGCKSCGCLTDGSAGNVASCDPATGTCLCKENVEGKQCRECKPGYFNLDFDNEFGCTPCFCYGHSSKCQSAPGYSKRTIETSFSKGREKWKAENQHGEKVETKYEAISQSIGVQAKDDETVYFVASEQFLGDQRGSYNQLLVFSLRIGETRASPSATDLILDGAGRRINNIIFAQSNPIPTEHTQVYKFRLHENSFYQWQPKLTYRDFISILSNLTSIKIRGTFSPGSVGFLDDVKLETASRYTAGEEALWMEFCECPEGYVGQFCESCAPGFRHSPAHGGPFTNCIPCECNDHANICDYETGKCICEHNTAGENCEFCARGYYGDALAGTPEDCKPCNCPGGGACIEIEGDEPVCTECSTGLTGHRCDICSDGYYGDPSGRFGTPTPCRLCECNQNIDTNAVGNCNTTSGECLKCIYNTGGSNCEECLPGFYGNALVLPKGDCKRCECNPIGTVADSNGAPICDASTGSCACKPHVIGKNCDQCEEGYYNLESGDGCLSCNCDAVGAFNYTCNVYSGHCYCREGITGPRCDHCETRKYGFSLEGCKDCDCDTIGSKGEQCDASGQCPCWDNVEGRRCDRCKENKFDRHRGCIDCPDCYNLVQHAYKGHTTKLQQLDQILEEIEQRPTVITDEQFSVELRKLEDDIDEFHDKVKSATGDDSVLQQVHDIRGRSKEVENILDRVNETLAIVQDKSLDAMRNNDKTDEVVETLEHELNEISSYFDIQAKRVLEDAWKKNKQFGQQSDKMTAIAQEARELADNLGDKSNSITETAQEARNKSIDAYEQIKKANLDQRKIVEEARKLNQEVNDAEKKLKVTKSFTEAVSKNAKQVKDSALELLNEANNLVVPEVDVPALEKRSNKIKVNAEKLSNKTRDLFRNSNQTQKNINDLNIRGETLLENAYEQQSNIGDLLNDVYSSNDTVVNTIKRWNKYLNDTETIYRDLQDFDSTIQKSKEEADQALKSLPSVEEIIDVITSSIEKDKIRLQENAETANNALNNVMEAKELEQDASDKLKDILEEAKKFNIDTNKMMDDAADLKIKAASTEDQVKALIEKFKFNDTLADRAKEKVGKAGKDTADVSTKVNDLVDDVIEVKKIIEELENSPNLDDNSLNVLQREIEVIEQRIDEKKLEDKLHKLQKQHFEQQNTIEDYKEKIRELERDVDNIEQIFKALPDGCFRTIALEP